MHVQEIQTKQDPLIKTLHTATSGQNSHGEPLKKRYGSQNLVLIQDKGIFVNIIVIPHGTYTFH